MHSGKGEVTIHKFENKEDESATTITHVYGFPQGVFDESIRRHQLLINKDKNHRGELIKMLLMNGVLS